MYRRVLMALALVVFLGGAFFPGFLWAEEAAKTPELVPFTKELADKLADSKVAMDTIWTLSPPFWSSS